MVREENKEASVWQASSRQYIMERETRRLQSPSSSMKGTQCEPFMQLRKLGFVPGHHPTVPPGQALPPTSTGGRRGCSSAEGSRQASPNGGEPPMWPPRTATPHRLMMGTLDERRASPEAASPQTIRHMQWD